METIPHKTELLKSSEIYVYLSQKRWEELTTRYDHEAGGGIFESRCSYDWFSIRYWDEDLQ